MHVREQWWLHCTSQWGWQTPLNEHVHCVAVTFKMTEWVKQRSFVKFVLSLNIPLQKLSGWFRRPRLWATGDWQLHHDNAPVHASRLVQRFLVKHQITQVTQPPYSPDLVSCNFWLFPKLKSPLKGKKFLIIGEIQENTTGQLMAIGRTVWGAYFEGGSGVIILCAIFLISSVFFNKCIFHSLWLDTFWTGLICHSQT